MMQLTSWGPMVGGAVLSLVLAMMPAADVQILGDGETEKFDLSELADGETRTLGSGDSEIVATRVDDVITIQLPGGGRMEARTMECKVGEGNCFAFVTGDDGASKVMVLSEDGNSVSKNVFVVRTHDDGDHVRVHEDHDVGVWHVGDGMAEAIVELEHLDGLENVVIPQVHVELAGKKSLRCPEGDTRMTLSKEDEGQTFYCPKHNVELEPVKIRTHGRTMIIRTDKDD